MTEEDPAPDNEIYTLDGLSLREKLIDIVEQQEESVRTVSRALNVFILAFQVTHCLFVPSSSGTDRAQRAEELNESIDKIIGASKNLNAMLDFGE